MQGLGVDRSLITARWRAGGGGGVKTVGGASEVLPLQKGVCLGREGGGR